MFHYTIRSHILFHCVAILGYHQVSSRHIPESRQCTLTFFTETSFRGAEQILSDSQGIFELDERSAKTVGRCCWRIYRYFLNHIENNGYKIITKLPNDLI